MHEDDLHVIKNWQQGNEQATHVLFNQYYPRMVRLAVLNGLTQDEAQDCAQDAFLRAFERRGQLRDLMAFPLWFQRLFTRHLLDVLKARQGNRQVPLEEIHEEVTYLSTQPEHITIATEWQEQLWQRVQALPATYRIPILLRYYEEYSLREIAHLLGKREGTIRVIISRALQRLRLDGREHYFSAEKELSSFSAENLLLKEPHTRI